MSYTNASRIDLPSANSTSQTQAIVAGPNIFVSGQIPADTKGNLIEGSIADKTKMCCENIKGILTEAGVGMDRIVKVSNMLFPGECRKGSRTRC
jgi:enamine deaminase RidA (YjgF/YER057c/UK114 family)